MSKRKTLHITNTSNIINHIDNSDSTQKNVDDKTDEMCKEVIDDLNFLNESITEKGLTKSKENFFEMIISIIEIFNGKKLILSDYFGKLDNSESKKLDQATCGEDVKDIPDLETEEKAKKVQSAKGLKIMTHLN